MEHDRLGAGSGAGRFEQLIGASRRMASRMPSTGVSCAQEHHRESDRQHFRTRERLHRAAEQEQHALFQAMPNELLVSPRSRKVPGLRTFSGMVDLDLKSNAPLA